MQNVWLKEHNRIAGGVRDALARRGGGFGRDTARDDEFIYQVRIFAEPLSAVPRNTAAGMTNDTWRP